MMCSARAKPSIPGIEASTSTRRERLPAFGGPPQRGQRLDAAVDRRRPHAPVGQQLVQDQPVGGVVVDDQDGQARAASRPGAGLATTGRAAGRTAR